MANNVFTLVFPVIFVSILLLVGVVVFGYAANVAADQYWNNERLSSFGCGNSTVCNACADLNTSMSSNCTSLVSHSPLENVTRAVPAVRNCTTAGVSCQTLTAGLHYNYSVGNGRVHILMDKYNGYIFVDYWQDKVTNTQDTNQQSLTGTVFSGFNLGMILVIVLAAAGIMSTILLVGRND